VTHALTHPLILLTRARRNRKQGRADVNQILEALVSLRFPN
jgi:hypothetical protein